jgi:signal transduction histidine kinase
MSDEGPGDARAGEASQALLAATNVALDLIGARDELRAKTRELERQTAVTRALFEVSQQLATVRSPDEVPDALGAAIRAATGASFSLVGRWDESSGRVIFVTADGVPAPLRRRIADIEATPQRYSMIRGGLEGRANVRVPPFDPTDLPVDLADAMGLTAIAGAPIVVGGRTWGLIAVATREGDPSIVESGVELLGGLASIAASAIGRAEAAALLERQADVLESTVAERTIQLRQAVDELTLANQARTEFLANVSHELRTPLTAIIGFTDVLLSGLDGPMTNVQLDDLRTIDASGRHLLALIDDLIDVSRIDAGRLELRVETIDLERLLANAVGEVRALADAKGLRITVSLDRLPDTIAADPVRVHEIVQNLLSNAVKFTPSGGTVALHATTDDDRRVVRIVVEDSGIGVPAEHQERIFDKFHRVAGPEYGGTGLGLAIARQYTERHGGSLTVESTPGLGSRFTVILPVDGPRPAGEDPSA